MSYQFIETAFGLGFVLIWTFIGLMLLRDSMFDAKQRRLDPENVDLAIEKNAAEPLAGPKAKKIRRRVTANW